MRKIITLCFCFLLSHAIYGQTQKVTSQPAPARQVLQISRVTPAPANGASSQSFRGSVIIPQLQSVEANSSNTQQVALHLNELMNGKTIENFCHVTVKSNIHWQLCVSANDNMIEGASQNNSLPVNIIGVKTGKSNKYIKLTDKPQILAISTSDDLVNDFNIDVKIDPTSDVKGDDYNLALYFTICPQ